ncbi:hypothetical protein [Fusobacterium periodonticum]|uniref:Uncharacterized protein n=1 Tax=Fusobacterium periodonticum 1_1_41FAA TaxID=469621 RepID=D6LHN6_9FUSO|nr:hypothetical protein [Fusobacterium periodonticum]EFG27912.1 hypothetical protein HMPREF0400_01244 [Fusobacterium periodonticum 1_1_41FAA]
MTKKFMNEAETKELIGFIRKLSTENINEENINIYFDLLENIYGKDGKKDTYILQFFHFYILFISIKKKELL